MAGRKLFRRNFQATITNLASNRFINIEGLRISFKLTKTNKSKGNRASIEIYNMSPDNRGFILSPDTKTGKPQTRLALYGGYGEESKLLFNGVGTASTEWDAPNYVSKFALTDALALTIAPFEKSYSKGAPLKSIIRDMLKALMLPTGTVQTVTSSLRHARSFSGPPDKSLGDLASTYGFIFDIQNGRSSIFLPGSTSERFSVSIGRDSGMIASPYWDGSIVKVRSLIIPEIIPNSIVSLEVDDPQIVGSYTVAKVTSKGDNWGENAFMDMELEPRQLEALYQTLPGLESLA